MIAFKSLIFLGAALVTIALTYLYQRHERVQSIRKIWIWPLIFTVIAARAVFSRWPFDDHFTLLLVASFAAGIPLGAARAFAFEVRSGEKPGTMILRPTLLSGAIFVSALLYSEFQHVFRWGNPALGRIACMLVVLSAGTSIAVNVTRLLRWKYQYGGSKSDESMKRSEIK